MSLLIPIFLFVFIIKNQKKQLLLNPKIERNIFIYFSVSTLELFFLVALYSSVQASSIKNDKTTNGVTIILDNEKMIISDSTTYYIGKTKNYLFVYHEKEKITDVYPMSRIKQMRMPIK